MVSNAAFALRHINWPGKKSRERKAKHDACLHAAMASLSLESLVLYSSNTPLVKGWIVHFVVLSSASDVMLQSSVEFSAQKFTHAVIVSFGSAVYTIS